MDKETELKVRIQDCQPTIEKLRELGALETANVVQTDAYYNKPNFISRGHFLRIREEGADVWLTYKGPLISDSTQDIKIREEHNTRINSAVELDIILRRLGFTPKFNIIKKRRYFRFEHCDVCIDEIEELGKFIEIEGPVPEVVQKAREALGLSQEGEMLGYAQMMMNKIGIDCE